MSVATGAPTARAMLKLMSPIPKGPSVRSRILLHSSLLFFCDALNNKSVFFSGFESVTSAMKSDQPTIIFIPSGKNIEPVIKKKKKARSKNDDKKSCTPPCPLPMPPPRMIRFVTGDNNLRPPQPLGENLFLSRSEHEYIQSRTDDEKKIILEKLKEAKQGSLVPRRIKIAMSNLPNKGEILKKMDVCDSGKFDNWIDYALSIPLGVYSKPPLPRDSVTVDNVSEFLKKTKRIMDGNIYGQQEAKDEVIRLMCQWAKSGSVTSFTLGLEGAPGIGKTTFAKSLQEAINRPFVFIGLGGSCDSATLVGHSYTYEGAVAGRLADAVKEAGCMDPIICIDELDKISKTHKGDEIVNTLLHLIDKEQNSHFRDRYLGFDMDFSKAMFIFSYNDPSQVHPILYDRLNVVKMKSPTVEDKVDIANIHLIPRCLRACSMETDEVAFSEEVIKYIINNYTSELGVRGLDRAFNRILSTLSVASFGAISCLSYKQLDISFPIACSEKMVDTILTRQREEISKDNMMYM